VARKIINCCIYTDEEEPMQTLFTLKDVAAQLNVAPYRVTYLVTSRQVEEPALRIGNVRVWTLPEIQVLATKLKTTSGDIARKDENDRS
jgi:hypothetical protein